MLLAQRSLNVTNRVIGIPRMINIQKKNLEIEAAKIHEELLKEMNIEEDTTEETDENVSIN